ncbi:MAG: hypothetical protein IH591_11440, partial [Bacteroidales bacterium]|nr:hypothetical protein [Bacteroidales bacterium]
MKKMCHNLRMLAFLAITFATVSISGQTKVTDKKFQPVVGQGGKAVVWVPTPQKLVDAMLD